MTSIILIEKGARHSVADLERLNVPGWVLATDFYVDGAEEWTPVLNGAGGLAHSVRRIVNVDHHAPLRIMQRRISSTNMALSRLEAGLSADPHDDAIVINHLDCDSVLASGVLSGRLEPHSKYGDAAIAADHTGEENATADLLQGLDAHWSRTRRPEPGLRDLEYFLESLSKLERSQALDPFAQEALAKRKAGRDLAHQMVTEDRFQEEGGVWFADLPEPLEGELVLPFLPHAALVVMVSPYRKRPDRWQVKTRLGLAAPEGLSLQDLGIEDFDPAYGGRWNAGSNNRPRGTTIGGTTISPEEYRRYLVEVLRRVRGLTGRRPLTKEPGCPLCDLRADQVVAETTDAVAIRDRYPVSRGHTLILPRAHGESLFTQPESVQQEIWRLVSQVRGALEEELAPDGFTIGVNDGRAASQTVLHAHVHVIPRFKGDVPDPRGGLRWVLPERAPYWQE